MVHVPVLVKELVELFDPCRRGVMIDATVGSGGHSLALLAYLKEHCPKVTFQLIALDRDSQMLARAKERLSGQGTVEYHHRNFAELKGVLVGRSLDGLVADLGFASEQLEPKRGFSFREAGPLDMRYNQTQELTAAEIVNHWPEAKLRKVIEQYSGERYADRIARAIVRRRPLYTTTQLAELVAVAVTHSKKGHHPATRTFQALRIAVNQELDSLEELLKLLPEVVNPGARVVFITFHSLEERIVRAHFKQWQKQKRGEIITKKPVTPSPAEISANPRSRSAHLWAFEFS